MRIISGKWKGRRFYLPKGVAARPTSEMIREAVFSIIRNEINGSVVLDMFAGSGAFSFEALSRGANHAIICDSDRKCITEIKGNLQSYKADKQEYTIFAMDFRSAMRKVARMGIGVDICYLDPPYSNNYYIEALELADSVMNPDGIVLLEHSFRDSMPSRIGGLEKKRERKYGGTIISIYEKETF